MAWPEDLDEQMRRRWRSRLTQERLDLSASVEATLESFQEGQFLDALETAPGPVQVPQKKVIIPPRLSLQSRSVPAVNPNSHALSLGVKRSFLNTDISDPAVPVAGVEPVTGEQSTNPLVRLAHRITSSLSSLLVYNQDVPRATVESVPSPLVDEPHRVYESSLALPVVHPPVEAPVIPALPAPRSTEMPPGQGKQRVPKRPSKVRLEVPSAQGTGTTKGTLAQMETRSGMPVVPGLFGSGMFEPGRNEVAVENAGVRLSSVVVVMLAGDPGPVVVQYVTLRPQAGFTVHLSAPALAKTPFNYVVLAREE